MRSFTSPSHPPRSCYFSIVPPTNNDNDTDNQHHHHSSLISHFSDETPCCSPTWSDGLASPTDSSNPLLASRTHPPALSSPTISVMQRQTAASYEVYSRPRIQDVLHVTSGESTSSTSSVDSNVSSPEVARCSRCQRTPSLDLHTGKSNMVQYGLNLWYCNRCAVMVGFVNR